MYAVSRSSTAFPMQDAGRNYLGDISALSSTSSRWTSWRIHLSMKMPCSSRSFRGCHRLFSFNFFYRRGALSSFFPIKNRANRGHLFFGAADFHYKIFFFLLFFILSCAKNSTRGFEFCSCRLKVQSADEGLVALTSWGPHAPATAVR